MLTLLTLSSTTKTSTDTLTPRTTAHAKSGEFLSFVHSMRGLAIAFVVALHVLDYVDDCPDGKGSWQVVARLLAANATVPFVFVSGFLFQHLSGRYRPGPYLWRRLTTVILPYLLISLPTILHQYWSHKGIFLHQDGRSALTVVLLSYLTAAHRPVPYWYIPVIGLFYVVSPLLIRLVRRPRFYWIIVPLLVLAMFLHRSQGHRLIWQSALYFLPVFVIGMAMSQYRERALGWLVQARWAVFLAVVALMLAEFRLNDNIGPIFSKAPFSTENGFADLDLLARIAFTALCFDFLRRYDARLRGTLAVLADTSFGIFFLHEPLLVLLLSDSVRDRIAGSAMAPILYALATAVVLLICVLVALGFRRVFGKHSRYLIGC
jgi:peptidoglycan/LPS O-acetylase OafA/YrhL